MDKRHEFQDEDTEHVAREMAPHALAYNLKWVMAILGVTKLLGAI